jgi:hypothetical protein
LRALIFQLGAPVYGIGGNPTTIKGKNQRPAHQLFHNESICPIVAVLAGYQKPWIMRK